MPAAVADAFTFLRTQIHAAFGTGEKAWFQTTAVIGAGAYSVGVTATFAPVTARAAADFGQVTVPTDSQTVLLLKSECPFEPRAGNIFIRGVTATGRKYKITAVTGADGLHSHYRVLAERHQ